MALAAAQIVDAIAARLKGNGITPAGVRVYTSRAWPLADDQLPAWRVTAEDEVIEAETMHYPAILTHELTVELEGTVRATANVDDAMHAMAASAMATLFGTEAASSLAPLQIAEMLPTGIRRLFSTQGEAVLAQVVVTLQVIFRTSMTDPETIIA